MGSFVSKAACFADSRRVFSVNRCSLYLPLMDSLTGRPGCLAGSTLGMGHADKHGRRKGKQGIECSLIFKGLPGRQLVPVNKSR